MTYQFQVTCADSAAKNILKEWTFYRTKNGIRIKISPSYAFESNEIAGKLVKEHWMRARVTMLSTNLPSKVWDQSSLHKSWLRNRLSRARIDLSISLLQWK